MVHNRFGRAAALAAASALLFSACGTDPSGGSAADAGEDSAGLEGNLSIGGSSAQESAMAAWKAGFESENSGVSVSYDPTGSGGGRTNFLSGGFAFAGSDAALDEEEKQKSQQQCGGEQAMHLPLYISPIAIAFNLKGVDSLQMSPSTIAKVFSGDITNWNDPAIAKENPDANLPDTPISPVHRSDDSGTTENFTDYLNQTAQKDWPHEADGVWPLKGGQSAQGTSGVTQLVQGGNGSITYADASKVGDLSTVKVKVGDDYVAYSPDKAAAMVDKSQRVEGGPEGDIEVELDRTSEDASTYPIVLVTYEIACQQYKDAKTGKLVKSFLQYIASEKGQKAAADAAGSAPISDKLRSDVNSAIDSIGSAK